MAAHTRTSRISRPKKIAALVGSGVGVAGVGLAAVLLSTSIGGFASVIDVPGTGSGPGGNGGGVSNSVSVDVTANAANGSNLDCSNITVSDDSTKLTFNPKLTKIAPNGPNADKQPVQGGQCTIFVDVANTGDVPIKVQDAQLFLPSGWNVSPAQGLDKTIAPGASQRLSADISATGSAVKGEVTGRLVYQDAPAAAPAS